MIIEIVVHGIFDFIIRKDWRIIYSSIWLLHLSRLLEAIHNFFELVFRALSGGILFLGHGPEESTILFIHIIWTTCAVLYGGRKANVRRRLRVRERVELVILQRASDSVRSGDVDLSDLATNDGSLRGRKCSLQMVFLWFCWSRVKKI